MSNPIDNVKTPIFAAVGAGDYAVAAVTDVVAKLRERAEERQAEWQARADETREKLQELPEDLPTQIAELREKFTPEELRKVAEAYIEVATGLYNSLAERGEEAIERLREQPGVGEGIDRAEAALADARELTEDALGTVAARTREVGERAVALGGKVSGRIADTALEVGADLDEAADRVVEAGGEASARVSELAGGAKKRAEKAAGKVDEAKEDVAQAPAKKAPAKKPAAKKAPAKKAPAKKAPANKTTK